MIVDVHTHTPRYRERPPEGTGGRAAGQERAPARPDRPDLGAVTWDDYMQAMAYVDRAVVFNIAPAPPGPPGPSGSPRATPNAVPAAAGGTARTARDVNDRTAELVRAHPEKLIGFMSVHPRDPQMLDEMDRCVGDLGLRGIKLGPNYQNFDPLGEDAFRLYARAQELGLPILFHQGTSPVRHADLDYAHPRHMDRVASRFPELRIVLAHLGHPWQIDCIAVIRKHPNVWADISALHYRPWSYYNCLRLATEWSVLHKLLFGSDYPAAAGPQETAEALPHVNDILEGTRLPPVPVDELTKILERDTLGILGL
jgi:predicted TIM-barrel fold metal-dependent hydrolase